MNFTSTHLWKGLLWFAVLCTLGNTFLDVNNWYLGLTYHEATLSKIFRFCRTISIASMSGLLFYQQSANKSIRLLFSAMTIAVVADGFLILANRLQIGMLFFIIVQGLLIWRHSPSILQFWNNKKRAITPFFICMLLFTTIYTIVIKYLTDPFLQKAILTYALILVVSVFFASLADLRSEFTKHQAQKILWGMILFFLCDLTVVMPILFPENDIAMFARALTGLMYTPALLLLASSGKNN